MKALLKWAGGKARLAPQISSAFGGPCRGVYFEPFLGSAAVFLHRKALGHVDHAVLSDVNPKLVGLHLAIRDEPAAVAEELAGMPVTNWQRHYYGIREAFNAGPHTGARHAARFIWLNRAGFNGLYRENRRGAFNVPVGRYDAVKLPDAELIFHVSALMQGVEILADSFEAVIRRAGPADQVYCDPPYVPLSVTATFTAYSKDPFGLSEQQSLARESQRAAFRGAVVVLSNHDLPLVRNELYPESSGFRHVARPAVARAISRDVQTRKAIREVIAAIGPMRHVA